MQSTLESQNVTIRSLSGEIKQLRELLLEKDRNAQKIVSKLNGLAKITLPSKTEKCKVENPAEKKVALTRLKREAIMGLNERCIIDKHAENGSRKGYFWAALSSRSSLFVK